MELNREEITRLSRMDDLHGHAWALYLLLKKHMESYTGLVHIDFNMIVTVLSKKLIVDEQESDFNYYIDKLLRQLLKVEIITDHITRNNFLSVKLPIAYIDTCLDVPGHH